MNNYELVLSHATDDEARDMKAFWKGNLTDRPVGYACSDRARAAITRICDKMSDEGMTCGT